MADCEWVILCDYAFNDSNGKSCLIGIFDRMFCGAVPAMCPRASLALRLSGSANEPFEAKVEVIRPTGGVLAKVDGAGALSESGLADLHLELVSLPLPDYGIYRITVSVNDAVSARTAFVVTRPTSNAPS